jgi:hypothetical protein
MVAITRAMGDQVFHASPFLLKKFAVNHRLISCFLPTDLLPA